MFIENIRLFCSNLILTSKAMTSFLPSRNAKRKAVVIR